MNNETVIVDVQGFKNNKNEFIVKELAIASQEHTHIFLIKPPYPFTTLTAAERKNVFWIEKNRGYRWSEGYIDYREFHRIIKPYLKNKKIIVKGEEKIKWVQELSKNRSVIDITIHGAPNLDTLAELYDKDLVLNCFTHKKICALKNVLCIRKWCVENKITV